MKPIAYDMSNIADMLALRHNKFALVQNLKEVDYKEAFFLCFNFIEDVMSTNLMWLNNTDYFSVAMEKIGHVWYCDNVDLGGKYYCEVLDALFLKVGDYLSTFMLPQCWDMWTIYRSGLFAIFTKGRDYRVVQWENLLNSGKVKPPSNKVILPKKAPPKKPTSRKRKIVLKGTESYIDNFNKV